jgi:hypothetical protein
VGGQCGTGCVLLVVSVELVVFGGWSVWNWLCLKVLCLEFLDGCWVCVQITAQLSIGVEKFVRTPIKEIRKQL